jgi:hypothetical protein
VRCTLGVTVLAGRRSSPCGFNGGPRLRSGLTREGGVLPFHKRLTLAKAVHRQPDGTSRYGSGYGGVGSGWAARVGTGLANGERRSAVQRVRVHCVEHNDKAVMVVRHGRFHGAQTSGR